MQQTQQERFTKAIGSTDISAIVGTSPFAGPWETYMRLTQPPEDNDNDLMKMGRDLEPYIVGSVAKLDPRWLVALGLSEEDSKPSRLVIREGVSRHLYFDDGLSTRSTPDGFIPYGETDVPVISIEAKLVVYGDLSAWSGELGDYDEWVSRGLPLESSVIPAYYADQCQWHMLHEGTKITIVPMLAGFSARIKYFVIPRDEERITELLESAREFWSNYITGDDTPPPDASPAMTQYLSQKETRADSIKDATGEHVALVQDFMSAKAAYDEAGEELDKLKNQIRAAVVDSGGDTIRFKDTEGAPSPILGKVTFKRNKAGRKVLNVKVKAQ